MGNEPSSPRPLEAAATAPGNVLSTSIGILHGGIIIGEGTVTNNYNFTETSGKIENALPKRHHDTGNWLLDLSLYENWKTMTNSFLWLHGLSGSGKTILCSMIVENVQSIVGEGSIGLAYYYFDISDVKKRTVKGLLSSLALRLYTCNPSNHTTVDQLYRSCNDGVDKPSGQQLEDLLKQLISGFKETYIVIDALDECKEWQELLKLLKRIHGWQIGQCHLLITSRKEQVIVKSLQHVAPKEIDLTLMPVEHDINKYIDEKVEESEELITLEPETKQDIKEQLKAKANGMFRWVACQIDALEYCANSPAALTRTLEMLPKDLETTYDQILDGIHPTNELHAVRLLYWLVFAIEPLEIEELAIVVQIDVEKNGLNVKERLGSPTEILKICSSLVALSEDRTVKLAHASVKEYFLKEPRKIGTRIIDPGDGDLVMAKHCLAYLHHPRETEEEQYWKTCTLPGYCGKLWHRHVLACKNEAAVKSQILMACDAESIAFENWKSWGCKGWNEYRHYPETPLEHAAVSGLLETVKWLIKGIILKQGGNVNAQSEYGNVIQAAASVHAKDIVELLLDNGADVNAQGGCYGNPLQVASSRGDKDIVELLLDKGADVNAQSGEYGNALQTASYRGRKDIVELLLDKGADVNAQGGKYGNALQAASLKGKKDIVELLLDKGADVNAQGGYYGNALQAASKRAHMDIVELLSAHLSNQQ
ncbi:hypothetical protein JOM56_000742 [Amanita muscaria]